MDKEIDIVQISAMIYLLPDKHPLRNNLINLLNSALRYKGILPNTRKRELLDITRVLKKEGIL